MLLNPLYVFASGVSMCVGWSQAAGALLRLCCHNPNIVKNIIIYKKPTKKTVFSLHQTEEAELLFDFWHSRRLPLLFILAFKDGSAVETNPHAESPLAVSRADRIRFNTALDFLSPQRKVRNGCLVFLRRTFVLSKIKRELDRYCVVKRNIKGSGQRATAAGENFVTRQQGPGILWISSSTVSDLTKLFFIYLKCCFLPFHL